MGGRIWGADAKPLRSCAESVEWADFVKSYGLPASVAVKPATATVHASTHKADLWGQAPPQSWAVRSTTTTCDCKALSETLCAAVAALDSARTAQKTSSVRTRKIVRMNQRQFAAWQCEAQAW